MGVANSYLNAFPPSWALAIVILGMGMAISAFVWVANLSDETKRQLKIGRAHV